MNNYYTMETTSDIQGTTYSLWQPESLTNRNMQTNTGINSNWKYRQYIQKNANEIMKYNTMQSINETGNNPYTLLNNKAVGNTPYLYNSVHDLSEPLYGYRNSDLKQSYMAKEQMKSRMIAPSISTNFTSLNM